MEPAALQILRTIKFNVWVVWTTFTFINIPPTPPDSEVHPDLYGAASNSYIFNGCLIRVNLQSAGVYRLDLAWDTTRTRERQTWRLAGAEWTKDARIPAGTSDDDHSNRDKDLTPSEQDHIYVEDMSGPSDMNATGYDQQVYEASFVQWATVAIESSPTVKCSENYLWHSVSWLKTMDLIRGLEIIVTPV